MYVRMYKCMCVCMVVCMCVCMHACTGMYVCMYVYAYVYMSLCMVVCMCVYVCNASIFPFFIEYSSITCSTQVYSPRLALTHPSSFFLFHLLRRCPCLPPPPTHRVQYAATGPRDGGSGTGSSAMEPPTGGVLTPGVAGVTGLHGPGDFVPLAEAAVVESDRLRKAIRYPTH